MHRRARGFVAPALAVMAAALTVMSSTAGAGGNERTLSARHAILGSPTDASTKPFGSVEGCQVLLDDRTGQCGVVPSAHESFVYTVEPGAYPDDVLVSRPWVIRVYGASKSDPDTVELVLESHGEGGDPGPLYAAVTAKVADVTGDDQPELVLGYRSEGTGQILDMDVVGTTADGAPKVLAHEQLYKGTVEIENGRIVTYAPVYKKTDANCCPTWIERDVVRFRDGAFRVKRGPRVPTKKADVPPGDLG